MYGDFESFGWCLRVFGGFEDVGWCLGVIVKTW